MTLHFPFLIAIPRRNAHCFRAQESLNDGKDYYSVLEEDEQSVLQRRDYCQNCWQALLQEVNPPKTYWKSKSALKVEEEKPKQNRNEQVLSLLKNALAEVSPESHEEAFVLALYLQRKRYLRFCRNMQKENGHTFALYEVVATEEMLAVPKLSLSQLNVAAIQAKLSEQLK